MKLFAKTLHSLGLRRMSGSELPDPYVRTYRIDTGPAKPGHETSPHWGIEEGKIFAALVNEADGPEPVADYLRDISDLVFTVRESESLYQGLYLHGTGTDVRAVIAPAEQQRWLPRHLRRPGWVYVNIGYKNDDTRFDTWPQYELLPVRQYRVKTGWKALWDF